MLINLGIALISGAVLGFLVKKAFKIVVFGILFFLLIQFFINGSTDEIKKIASSGNVIQAGKAGFEKIINDGKDFVENHFIRRLDSFSDEISDNINGIQETFSLDIYLIIAFGVGFIAGILKG